MKPPKTQKKYKNYYLANEKHRPKPPKEYERCHHITKIGKRCRNRLAIGNLCLNHYFLISKRFKKKNDK